MSDAKLFGKLKFNLAAIDIVRAHQAQGPNRRARRTMVCYDRSVRARRAAHQNQALIPPGALHPYMQGY